MARLNFTNCYHRVTNCLFSFQKRLFLLLMIGVFISPFVTHAQYCTPTTFTPYGQCAGGSILNVTFNTINNSAGCVSGGVPADYYKNFTATVTPTYITPGNTYFLSVTHSVSWAGGAAVWIDYNCNQVFEASERVLFSSSTSVGGILSGNITVPGTAQSGTSRMRIMAGEGAIPSDPCDPNNYAEVEDYTVMISEKPYNNAGVTGKQHSTVFCAGPSVNEDIRVRVANLGANQITSLQINWEVDGVSQSPISFTSLDTLNGSNPSDTLLLLGPVSFPTSAAKTIKAWTSLPNGVADTTNNDDTLVFTVRPLMNGTYTIGFGGDFSSLTDAVTQLQNGICGAVTLNYTGTNNTYEEQVLIPAIPGASAANPVIINGNNNTLTFNTSVSASRYVIRLQGAKHITLNNLVIKPTGTTYGWGIHLTGNADSNTVHGCTILIESVTSITAANSVGIVINNSNTTAITAGGPNTGNVISNNYIKGAATGGMYYGIVIAPSSASATATYTKVVNNTIEDFYAYGIYATQINNALIKGNIIRNVTKTANNATVWGIALITGARLSAISENQISNPFGAQTTSTGVFYGIQSTSTAANTPAGSENLFANNIIYNSIGNGTFTGVSLEPAPNSLVYHNTINFDNTSSAPITITRGVYQSGTAAGIQLRNNVISITRGGTGLKHLLYFNTAANSILSNNNGLFISSSATNHVGYSSAANRTLLADWNTSTNQDTASVFVDPVFAYAASGNLEPQSSALNDIGSNATSSVPNDIRQSVRSATPDPGAFEYTPSGCLTPSGIAVSTVTSAGAQISWTEPSPAPDAGYEYYVDTTATPPTVSGTTHPTASVNATGLDPSTKYYVFVRSVCGVPSAWAGPVSFTTLCAPLAAGTYSLGGPGADFSSFTQLANRLNCGSGIAGPVVVNVTPGLPPFNEQFVLGPILNSDLVNTVTINGNGNTIQTNATSAQRSIIRLEGVNFVTIDSLTIKTTNATYGWGVHFYQNASNNVIKNCIIDISTVTSTAAANSGGIIFSNSLTAATTAGANGVLNTIENNLIIGNPTGAGMYYGIVLAPATAAATYSGNQVIGNIIRDFYSTGIHCLQTNGSTIKGNIIENTTKPSLASSVYGISMNTAYRSDVIADNEIRNLTGGSPASSATVYGISLSNTTTSANITPVGNEMNVFNNVIHNIKGSGNIYGIYASNATNIRYYHNTIIIDDSNNGSGFSRGFHHTGSLSGGGLIFKNNIVSVNRNTTGTNHSIYLNTNTQPYTLNNNAYWVGGSNAFVGYLSGSDFGSLNSWKNTTGFDAGSRFCYADFVDLNNNNLTPDAGLINNIGDNLLGFAPVDKNGTARTGNPDPGAFEFTPTQNVDAGVLEIILPKAVPVGATTPAVTIFNAGTQDLISATIEWEVNGILQTSVPLAGTIPSGGISSPIPLTSFSFASGTVYAISAWTSAPNATVDGKPHNDTASIGNIVTAIPAGNYTINSAMPNSATNYSSFASFIQEAETVGISGAIELTVIDTFVQGPIVFGNEIPGTSSVHTITVKSSDTSTTTISSNTANTITLNNVDHVVFRNLIIENTNASSSSVIWLTNSADSNTITNCTILSPIITASTSTYGILASASVTSKTAGNNAKGTLIDSCIVKGANEGVVFMGVLYPALPEEVIDPRINSYNQVAHSTITNSYTTAIHAQTQSRFIADKNEIVSLGNGVNTFTTGINLRENIFLGSFINANTITGALGGSGIAAIWDESVNSIVSNNMIQMGAAANDVLAIRWIGTSASIVYNSVNVTTTNANGCALSISPTEGNRYSVYNNILKNDNPGQIVNYTLGTGVVLDIDNNVYYGTGNLPYRFNNTNYSTLPDLRVAMGISNDLNTLTIDPVFVSDSNLRTFNPILNNKGTPFALVTTDIDGNVRNASTPDVGVNEFNLPPFEDAGIIAITIPSLPVIPGVGSDVNVVIKNFGVGPLTSAEVSYSFNSISQTISYTGNLAEGETDTIRFTLTNLAGITIPATGGFEITAWTYLPNFVVDKDHSNDSLVVAYCQPLSGTYTINPAGTGATNFLSFNDAVNTLKCGGVSDAVTINVATGVYNEQFEIPYIPGASGQNTITFKSSTGNKADVQLNYASTNDSNNFIVKFVGATNIIFSDISFNNSGAAHSRVFAFSVVSAKSNEHITIRNCELSGVVPTVNSSNTALIFAPDNNAYLTITNNVFNNGGISVLVSGNPVVGQYSDYVVIDSNIMNNFAYAGISAGLRRDVSIKHNTLISNSSSITNAISSASTAGSVAIVGNKVNIPQGTGILVYQNAYYNELGRALVASNAVLVHNTGNVGQTGIKIQGGSKVDVYSNTIKINSISTSSAGLHIEGDITYSNLANTISYDVKILNNIIQTENGYPLNVAELWFDPANAVSQNAISLINNNIYYNTNGVNVARVITTNYAKSNFNAFKNAVNVGSDNTSKYLPVVFESNTSVKPLESDITAWYVNGRALHLGEVNSDAAGAARSTVPYTGVPDMGAFEITPSVLPPLASATPALPAPGVTQSFMFLGDTVAKIHWDALAPVPGSVEVRQFVGEAPPQISAPDHHMFAYVSLEMPTSSSSSYSYNADFNYKAAWLGTIAFESLLRMSIRDSFLNWSVATSTIDSVGKRISGFNLYSNNLIITGADVNNPLPVQLLSFTAQLKNKGVNVDWTSASEINASHFAVERSVDGVRFVTVQNVKARNKPGSYLYYDDLMGLDKINTVYYRLKSIDWDGAFSYSHVVSVNLTSTGDATVLVAPNPVDDFINLHFTDDATSAVEVSLFDMQGQLLDKQNFEPGQKVIIPSSGLAHGLYLLKVRFNNKEESIRILKK